MIHIRSSARAAALFTAVGMVVGLPACGSDGGGASASSAEDARAVKAAFERQQIALYASNQDAYCEGLTARAREETSDVVGPDKPCEELVQRLVPNAIPASIAQKFKSRVTSVEIDGDQATVAMRTFNAKKPIEAPWVKEDGQWKSDSALKQQLGTP